MRRKHRPVIVAVVSDVHAGSTVAVCPPNIALDDGGTYEATKAQRWLWENWLNFWSTVEKRRDSLDASLYTVFNGDLTEGYHHGTTQILTANPTAQAAVVDACLHPVLDLDPDKLFFVRGTEAHVGKSAAYEERVATGLWKDKRPVQREPDTKQASWWSLAMEVQGVRLSFKHHGRIGSRPWTKHNNVVLLAKQIFMEHAERGKPHPHLAIRSHYHTFVDTGNAAPTRVVQTPAWQLHTGHSHKVVPENISDTGGIIITIQDGAFSVDPILYEPLEQPVWRAA